MARIFISSTCKDLKKEREAAIKAVHRLGHQAIYMEAEVARDGRPVDLCVQDVKTSHIYVGIFAFRYGYVPEGFTKSITHLEYEAAVEAGIPCLIFLLDPTSSCPVEYVDTGDERKKIDQLRQELGNKHWVKYYKNANKLGTFVKRAVRKKISELKDEMHGQVPKNQLVRWLVGACVVLAAIMIVLVLADRVNTTQETKLTCYHSIVSMVAKTSKSRMSPPLVKVNPPRVSDVRYEMVEIPGGSFQMGTNSGGANERPVHTVQVSAFRLGKTEVTQGLWSTVMGNNPSGFPNGDDYPVENVSWNDCQKFIRKLNRMIRGNYRLPTEAEWEYACRAGTIQESYGKIDDISWHKGNCGRSTHPVGKKKPNAFGLFDMSGNVYEWCSDWYGPYDSSNQIDPTGPASGTERIIRGGSWFDDPNIYLNSAIRNRHGQNLSLNYLGFRLASGSANGG